MTDRVVLQSLSPEQTRRIGERIGQALTAGDVVVLDGELGAGKTTLTQGIARGLQIDEPATSPTFVVAREMPAGRAGVSLLHVDAYRISSLHEWDDLDVELEAHATVIEWGERVVGALPSDRLEVQLSRSDGDARTLVMSAHGDRSRRLLAAVGESS